jgi:hypothetical protein
LLGYQFPLRLLQIHHLQGAALTHTGMALRVLLTPPRPPLQPLQRQLPQLLQPLIATAPKSLLALTVPLPPIPVPLLVELSNTNNLLVGLPVLQDHFLIKELMDVKVLPPLQVQAALLEFPHQV